MKTTSKKALFLHVESREYRGLRRVRNYKTLAHRIERRTSRAALKAACSD